MEPGDALFFHCNLLHRSDQNRSEQPALVDDLLLQRRAQRPVQGIPPPALHAARQGAGQPRFASTGRGDSAASEGSDVWLAEERDTTASGDTLDRHCAIAIRAPRSSSSLGHCRPGHQQYLPGMDVQDLVGLRVDAIRHQHAQDHRHHGAGPRADAAPVAHRASAAAFQRGDTPLAGHRRATGHAGPVLHDPGDAALRMDLRFGLGICRRRTHRFLRAFRDAADRLGRDMPAGAEEALDEFSHACMCG